MAGKCPHQTRSPNMNKFNEDMCEKIIAIAKRIVAPDYEEELR